MTDLQCGVSACAYWCSGLCSREAISVFGASARKKEETGYGSFYPRFDSGGKLENAGIAGPGCEIACDAENCIYNDERFCDADAVRIERCGAVSPQCDQETKCGSFVSCRN